jgi:hypothetical protein
MTIALCAVANKARQLVLRTRIISKLSWGAFLCNLKQKSFTAGVEIVRRWLTWLAQSVLLFMKSGNMTLFDDTFERAKLSDKCQSYPCRNLVSQLWHFAVDLCVSLKIILKHISFNQPSISFVIVLESKWFIRNLGPAISKENRPFVNILLCLWRIRPVVMKVLNCNTSFFRSAFHAISNENSIRSWGNGMSGP